MVAKLDQSETSQVTDELKLFSVRRFIFYEKEKRLCRNGEVHTQKTLIKISSRRSSSVKLLRRIASIKPLPTKTPRRSSDRHERASFGVICDRGD